MEVGRFGSDLLCLQRIKNMAVWMHRLGKRTLPQTLDERIEECKQVMKTLELDLTFLQGRLEPKTAYDALHKKLKPDYWSYNKVSWITKMREHSVGLYYPLYADANDTYGSIRISLYQDILSISGPFDHFSHYGTITQEDPLRNGYQNLVRQICEAFKVNEVVYFSEWCYSTDDFDTYQELKAFLEAVPEKQVQQLNQICYSQEYYIEQIDK
jgi:hypothetical protein